MDKIYLVVVKVDKHHVCNGIDDIKTEVFTNINIAREYLKNEYEKAQKTFIDSDGYYYTDYDEFEDDYFVINDGCDYYSAEIREKTLNEAVVYECKGNGDK